MMHCGNPDPKHLLHEMDARLGNVAWRALETKETALVPHVGPLVWLRALLARLTVKEATDV